MEMIRPNPTRFGYFERVRMMAALVAVAALLSGCANHADHHRKVRPMSGKVVTRAVAKDGIFADSRRASKGEVLAFLEKEGILSPGTKVVSATWERDLDQWLVILRHSPGRESHWFVDPFAREYHGGTCNH